MTTAVREAPHHNTLTCYTDYRCRRPECKERYNAYRRERRRAENQGTWQPFADARPVREHLLHLQEAGIGFHRVAALTGLPYNSVRDFLYPSYTKRRGRKTRTSHDTAAKILALQVGDTLPGRVDATATRRRIQALVAHGWPMLILGPHIGCTPKHVWKITTQRYVYRDTVAAVEDAYNRLRHLRPEKNGVGKREAHIARTRAASHRWPTPAYWDDYPDLIGDPDFEPLYGVSRREIVAQDAAWVMRTTGLDKTATAARLGIHKSYLDHAFREHPQYAVEQAA